MAGNAAVVCGRCQTTATKLRVGKLDVDPAGWCEPTLTGKPIKNMRLCSGCSASARWFLESLAPLGGTR
jgi:hypothetical protein